ncbi:MAG TPA: TonB-dependent receptor, partial [Rhizomicrobium sp.]
MCITVLAGGLVTAASGRNFDVPSGDLEQALKSYIAQTGVQLVFSASAVKGVRTNGAKSDVADETALSHILAGTGFVARHDGSVITIVRDARSSSNANVVEIAAATAPSASGASLETVTVTSSKIGGDVQNIPISITALSQEQLTATQTAGGPDLIKQVPNMTFTKTNFSGYSIQLRGIGTQAISVTTDPAVAVAFNDIPFIRNHFFEQEFYDVSQVEVLRGPQGTLYGRNATAGVVNLVSAKPSDQFEAMASADVGNYQNRRLEAMINIPVVDDELDIRLAGEWTKRQGYSLNEETDDRIDGRDLWSGRATIGWKPFEDVQTYLVWEHFSEDDDRLRSSKQLCKTDYGPGFVAIPPTPGSILPGTLNIGGVIKTLGPNFGNYGDYFSQGCGPASLYSPDSYQAPLGFTLPYILGLQDESDATNIDPYASETQSHNLRVIDSGVAPKYSAKNDVVEFHADYTISPTFTFTSETGFGHDFLYSAEDYNRFGASPGLFIPGSRGVVADPTGFSVCTSGGGACSTSPIGAPCTVTAGEYAGGCTVAGYFCDPQLGCSNQMILEDLSEEHAWQLSQEFRVASNFSGPLNFSAGGNYLHYETEENYYVFGNVFTLINGGFVPGRFDSNSNGPLPLGFQFNDPSRPTYISLGYADPNPISHLDGNGHNYFVSKNPYVLNSYAAFGEANYNLFSDLKFTGGLRWTQDQKHFSLIPSWLVDSGWGYPVAGVVNQQWDQLTGRAVANWTPKLDFTDQTLIYGSYAHGYKAGGANPPGAIFSSETTVGSQNTSAQPTHPLTFKPEFIDAFEVGTKNT